MSTKKPAKKKSLAKKPAPTKRAPAAERVKVGGLRTLGDVEPAHQAPPKRTGSNAKIATQARDLLQAEFAHVLMMKEKLAAESSIGGREKGRDALRGTEKLRSLVSSLEGMSRFALKMGLITPAESRELYAQAMKKGLYDGWR